jgi:hypothetical protein
VRALVTGWVTINEERREHREGHRQRVGRSIGADRGSVVSCGTVIFIRQRLFLLAGVTAFCHVLLHFGSIGPRELEIVFLETLSGDVMSGLAGEGGWYPDEMEEKQGKKGE